jgi:hypothetical protein
MNTRPAPSLLGRDFHDLVLGLVCFPGNQPTVCSPDWTGRGRRSSVASNPICVSDASGLSKRFLELERILDFLVSLTIAVIAIWAVAIGVGLLLDNLGRRISPDLDIWKTS